MALALVLALCHVAAGCNVREIGEIIRSRYQQQAATDCGALGDKCTFDRDCCTDLECRMAVTNGGVDNYCQARIEATTVNMADVPYNDEPQHNEPSSPEDGAWMLANLMGSEEEGDTQREVKPSGNLDQIEILQEKAKVKLIKENQELERLFTEKEEKELETLRALKEDAEMDELRRLKELRLKRKLQLLKELRELRTFQAEDDLNRINELKNKSLKEEQITFTTEGQEIVEAAQNGSSPAEQTQDEVQTGLEPETNPTEDNKEVPEEPVEPDPKQEVQETEVTDQTQEPKQEQIDQTQGPPKHNQGIHHHKKHHQHRQKKKQKPTNNPNVPNEEAKGGETNVDGATEKTNTDAITN